MVFCRPKVVYLPVVYTETKSGLPSTCGLHWDQSGLFTCGIQTKIGLPVVYRPKVVYMPVVYRQKVIYRPKVIYLPVVYRPKVAYLLVVYRPKVAYLTEDYRQKVVYLPVAYTETKSGLSNCDLQTESGPLSTCGLQTKCGLSTCSLHWDQRWPIYLWSTDQNWSICLAGLGRPASIAHPATTDLCWRSFSQRLRYDFRWLR